MGKDWGWTDLTYDHIKDWTTLPDEKTPPDPKQYESGGFLQSLYNKLPDWITGTTPPKNDISGLSANQRLSALQPQYDPTHSLPSIPNQTMLAHTLQKATGIGQDPDAGRTFAREHPWLAKGGELLTGYPFTDPGIETGPVDLLGQFAPIAHGLARIGEAGLPFMLLHEGKPVFHGTPSEFETFDPSKYDDSDLLGWMTHAASDPDYAEQYATGEIKHGYEANRGGAPRIIPIHSEAQNVLDLVNPNADDLAHALAALDPGERRQYIRMWKDAHATPESMRWGLKSSHYPDPGDIPTNEVPARYVGEKLRLNAEQFERTPFDAIKYRDVNKESWAFPKETPLKSAVGGVPLTKHAPPVKVVRAPEGTPVSKSELTPVVKKNWNEDPAMDALYNKPPPPDPLGETENWDLPDDLDIDINDPDNFITAAPIDEAKHYMGKKVNIISSNGSNFDATIKNKFDLNELQYHIDNGATVSEISPSTSVPSTSKLKTAKGKLAPTYAENQAIDDTYSHHKVKDMIDAADEHGIDWTEFPNYKALENYLLEFPINVPGHGKLTKKEAMQLASAGELSFSKYDKYFPW